MEIKRVCSYSEEATSPYIFGSFIESGFGRQVSGMWAEMLYNRCFRKVPPYKNPTWEWLGLEKDYYNENAPFWHSGYEEYDWTFLEGTRHELTCGTETHKGKSSLLLHSGSNDGPWGMEQKGIHLEKGRDYLFRLFAGAVVFRSEAGLNGFMDAERAENKRSVLVMLGENRHSISVSGVPQEYLWQFTAKESGVFTMHISFAWQGSLICAYTSLMPADAVDGWRREVVQCIKKAAQKVVRFPGGCFTSFFDWRASVGDRQRREPQESFYWGGIEENDVGLGELCHLGELCGFESQICFNMMSSTPFDAMCMIEYLNAPSNVGYGRLRALDGHPEPYHITLFECDNEPNRKYTAEQYAHACHAFITEMRKVTPEAKFMLAAYGYSPALLPQMLDIAGQDVDYVIYRRGDVSFVREILPVLRAYNQKHERSLKLVNTEWLPSCRSPEPFEDREIPTDFRWKGKIINHYKKVFSRQQISWNYALNGAQQLLQYLSYGKDFYLANFNNMANTYGQNLLECSKDKVWLSAMGEIFAFFDRNYRSSETAEGQTGDDRIYALFTCREGKEKLFLINHSAERRTCVLPKNFFAVTDGLFCRERGAFVTENDSPIEKTLPQIENGSLVLEGLSILCIE